MRRREVFIDAIGYKNENNKKTIIQRKIEEVTGYTMHI